MDEPASDLDCELVDELGSDLDCDVCEVADELGSDLDCGLAFFASVADELVSDVEDDVASVDGLTGSSAANALEVPIVRLLPSNIPGRITFNSCHFLFIGFPLCECE